MRYILVFLLVAIVFSSGCIGETSQTVDVPEEIENNNVVLTRELKDEICYEMDTYIEYCYSQGNALDQCASETLEKVKRIYGITNQQFLEVNDYCYSDG